MQSESDEVIGDLLDLSRSLSRSVSGLEFTEPVTYVYNPLDYAWEAWAQYLSRFGSAKGRVLLLGMNPGPWGMAQTGIPFGEVSMVREWMGIDASIGRPASEHPKRPIEGFACTRSEVSGRRLWGWARDQYGSATRFFEKFFVANYCPLVFMEATARNRTPDKLPAGERSYLFEVCDRAFRQMVEALEPEWVVGVGRFATQRAEASLDGLDLPVGQILHPSPASPAANRGWRDQAVAQLTALGIPL